MTKLKFVRLRRGLRQKMVSAAVDVDNGTYCRIELGKMIPTAAAARRIARFFGHEVTEMEILYPEDYMVADEQKAS